MKVNENHLIVLDEQGYYRLLKRDASDKFGEVVSKIKADSKDAAKNKFQEMGLI